LKARSHDAAIAGDVLDAEPATDDRGRAGVVASRELAGTIAGLDRPTEPIARLLASSFF